MTADPIEQPLSWADWLAQLNAIACGVFGSRPMTDQTGEECWQSFFDDGMTPQQAWNEELSCVDR